MVRTHWNSPLDIVNMNETVSCTARAAARTAGQAVAAFHMGTHSIGTAAAQTIGFACQDQNPSPPQSTVGSKTTNREPRLQPERRQRHTKIQTSNLISIKP